MLELKTPIEFEWDNGNIDKNLVKHGVSNQETEEAFIAKNKIISQAKYANNDDIRWQLYSYTKANRYLIIIFTVRKNKIRVISARDMHKTERSLYDKSTKNSKL